MSSQNGTAARNHHHAFDAQLDALKENVHRLVDRISKNEDSRFGGYVRSATQAIREHPVAAAALAFAVGYAVFRALRRS